MKNLFLIALSTVAVSAHAWEPEVYVGAGTAAWQYQHSSSPSNFTTNTIEGIAGMRLAKFIAVEARLGVGLNSPNDDITFTTEETDPTTNNKVKMVDDFYGESETAFYGSFFLKPMISNEKASLYGLIGYTMVDSSFSSLWTTTTTTTTPGTDTVPGVTTVTTASTQSTYDDSEGEVSFGVGASFVMSAHTELTAEWRNVINNDVVKLSGGTVGFIYKF